MTDIHYEILGQGQPLVMLHGWAMHSQVWADFADVLSQHFQVILIDLPGHGFSDAVESFELDTIVAALLPVLPEQKIWLMGWSLGATIALAMAQRVPERIEHLIILAGNPQFVQTDSWPGVKVETLEAFADMLKVDVQQTLIRFLALQVSGLAHGKALLHRLKRAIQACPAPSDAVLQAGLRVLKTSDLRAVVSRNEVSIRLILGDKDTLIPVECGRALQQLNPYVSVCILDSAGHAPFLSHPQQLLEAILCKQ